MDNIDEVGKDIQRKIKIRKVICVVFILFSIIFGISVLSFRWLSSLVLSDEDVNTMAGAFFSSMVYAGPYFYIFDTKWYAKKLLGDTKPTDKNGLDKKFFLIRIIVVILSIPVYILFAVLTYVFFFPQSLLPVIIGWLISWLLFIFFVIYEIRLSKDKRSI